MAKKEKDAKKDDKEDKDAEKPAEGDAATPEGGEAGAKKDPLAFLSFLPAKLRLPFIIGVPVLIILVVVLILFLGGSKKPDKAAGKDGEHGTSEMVEADGEEGAKEGEKKEEEASVFYNLPDMLVNLDSRGRKQSVLKMAVTLELSSEKDLAIVEEKAPRVLDEFQVFLREVRIEDLRGSAGIYRMRQELLARVKPAVTPVKVKDVLFKELLVQ